MERVILCAFSLVFLMMGKAAFGSPQLGLLLTLIGVQFYETPHVAGTTITGSDTGKQEEEYRARKLFVFGDSYADTGNLGKKLGRNIARSWFEPYGMTFPKKPTGRFSDGKVLTDYLGQSVLALEY